MQRYSEKLRADMPAFSSALATVPIDRPTAIAVRLPGLPVRAAGGSCARLKARAAPTPQKDVVCLPFTGMIVCR
jgi:hypothetical protein